jgi:UDP-N-acetylglucosamine 3-dehydrogenase
MSRAVRVAVIGAGLVAQRSHLPAYAAVEEADIAAIVSGRIETARVAAERFGVPRVLVTWQDVVSDPEIDAVDICTPNALHAPIAIAAARAGKHVLVEKPMAVTVDEADAMIAAARAAGVVLMVAHNLRFVPVFETIKEIVAAGTIGRLLAVRSAFMHAGPDEAWGATSDWFWRAELAGGGSMLDLGIHMIDLVRWFVDRPVIEVTAMTARRIKPTFADDSAIALLRFEGDVLASVQSSWAARPFPDRHIMIHGELGYVSMSGSAAEPLAVHLVSEEGSRAVVPTIPDTSTLGNPYVHFIRCIQQGIRPLTSGEEGRASLAVALAAYESARTGRTVTGHWEGES